MKGMHFKCKVYHANPTPGVYLYDDIQNGGYAMRMIKPDGFVGRNKKGLVSIYAKYGDDLEVDKK